MTIRKYEITAPSNETELGVMLRNDALARGVLDLLVIEYLNELDMKRTPEPSPEIRISMEIDSVHLRSETTHLPFINGSIVTLPSGNSGTGRLEVNGSAEVPLDQRTLTLYTSE